MKQSFFTLTATRPLADGVWELTLSGDTSALTAPGQFVHIALPGHFLRRPVSVCAWTADSLTLLVREAGSGTRELVRLPPGTELDTLSGLGNGFQIDAIPPDGVILAGGGIGIAPLYGLAVQLRRRGIVPAVALGFRNAAGAFYLDQFAALGCQPRIATEDGGLGYRGFVTDLLLQAPNYPYVCSCGPSPMLRAVHALNHLTGGQFSFEARMACGFGACMGCSIPTASGMARVCRDGPVFFREEIVWRT